MSQVQGTLVHDPLTNAPPPEPVKMPVAPATALVETALRTEHAEFLTEAEKWIASVARAPAVIEDEVTAGKVAKTITELVKARTKAETIHAAAKKPWFEITKTIDSMFLAGVAKRAEAGQKILEAVQKRWLKKKEDEERIRLANEARARQQEADRLREQEAATLRSAERAMDSGDMDRAQEILTEAVKVGETAAQEEQQVAVIENRAEGGAADLVRTHHSIGVTTSLKKFWTAELLPLEGLKPEQELQFWRSLAPYIAPADRLKAAKAAAKAGLRDCPGLKIFEDSNPINR